MKRYPRLGHSPFPESTHGFVPDNPRHSGSVTTVARTPINHSNATSGKTEPSPDPCKAELKLLAEFGKYCAWICPIFNPIVKRFSLSRTNTELGASAFSARSLAAKLVPTATWIFWSKLTRVENFSTKSG